MEDHALSDEELPEYSLMGGRIYAILLGIFRYTAEFKEIVI